MEGGLECRLQFDFVVERAGGPRFAERIAGGDDTFDQAIKMTKPGGRVILVAFYHGPITADVSDAVRRNLTIYTERGAGGASVGRTLALLAAGRIRAKPLVSQTFPLADVHHGFEVVEKRIGDPIKVIIHP